jgi:hypothetical protein
LRLQQASTQIPISRRQQQQQPGDERDQVLTDFSPNQQQSELTLFDTFS